jgi:MYXO-CTERM domain-containing protein
MKLASPDNTAGRRAPPPFPRALAQAAWVSTFLSACFALACAPSADGVVEVVSALGEPMGDYPGYEERVVLYATNRARVSPATEGWPSYAAQPPMQWSYQLNQSSRAHSLDMRDTPCFQHPSCDGTDPFVRIKTFYTGPWTSMGENISAGSADPQMTVHDWIYEVGAAAGETGHRDAIFSKDFTLVGAGFAAGGMTPTTKLKNFWTEDFVGTSVKRPRLTDGIHFPASVAAGGKATFGATYYDAAVGAGKPQLFAAIDGACTGLAFVRGTTALGAYEGAATLADGCHAYYFVATLGDGVALATYPATGALQVGAGSAASTCALFTTTRPAATCAGLGGGGTGTGASGAAGAGGGGTGVAGMNGTGGTTGAAGAMGAGGTTGAAGAMGAGGATPTGGTTAAAGTTGVGGTKGSAGSSGSAGTTGAAGTTAAGAAGAPPPTQGAGGASPGGSHNVIGMGCAVAPDADHRSRWLWMLALGFAIGRTRRRSR